MRARTFLAQATLWIVAVAAINVLIARLTVNALPRQVVRAIDHASHVTDVVAGNSVMVAAIDAATFESFRPGSRVLNVALGSTSPIEHDLLVRRAMRLAPARVVYGFFDTQLTRPVPNRLSDLKGTRAMIFYVDREQAIRLLADDGPPAWQIRAASLVPMFVERAALWGTVERLRRSLASIGSPPQATGRFGRTADFAGLEDDPRVFRDYCAGVVANRTPLLPAVVDLLDAVRAGRAQPIVVFAPMTSRHRRTYYDIPEWRAYLDYVRAQIATRGAAYVDASAWIPDEEFEDAVHVSARGALNFTRRLADRLSGDLRWGG
jgi:hypothetical protein